MMMNDHQGEPILANYHILNFCGKQIYMLVTFQRKTKKPEDDFSILNLTELICKYKFKFDH